MTNRSDAPTVSSAEDLLAIAYQIEVDAVERYAMLAEQMDSHNNPELAAVFRDLARAENIHAQEIRKLAAGLDLEGHARRVARWQRTDSPEAADLGAAHYLMTRGEALRMALAGEERARDFFKQVLAEVTDPRLKTIAQRFFDEEVEHVELCEKLLRKHGDAAARVDPDPAASQD